MRDEGGADRAARRGQLKENSGAGFVALKTTRVERIEGTADRQYPASRQCDSSNVVTVDRLKVEGSAGSGV